MPRHIVIAETFTKSLKRLPHSEQKKAKIAWADLQTDPDDPKFQLERLKRSKDPDCWSAHVTDNIRIILHKTASRVVFAYVDRHDDAYRWAQRAHINVNLNTGAVQIVVEPEEGFEESTPQPKSKKRPHGKNPLSPRVRSNHKPVLPFRKLGRKDLRLAGVPEEYIDAVLNADGNRFFAISEHLPGEASEALFRYIKTGILSVSPPVHAADPFQHPDAQRRFRAMENIAELKQALEFPWEEWILFLHPSQRKLVDRDIEGPMRVLGSAGTGKTVVALHRSLRLAKQNPNASVLLTTVLDPLARALKRKIGILARSSSAAAIPNIEVVSCFKAAANLYRSAFGRQPIVAKPSDVKRLLKQNALHISDQSILEFLVWEWTNVVDAQQIASRKAYVDARRPGSKVRMNVRQRDELWSIFENVQREMAKREMVTKAGVFQAVADHYRTQTSKPFTNIVADEAQDLGVLELKFLAAIAPDTPNPLFFAGDLGQRILQQPFSWKELGVNVMGRRSTRLTLNYRTSHQIREAVDLLLPKTLSDGDGETDDRHDVVSTFNSPEPIVVRAADEKAERAAVVEFIREAIAAGVRPEEIGIFVRTDGILGRAREAVREAGKSPYELTLFNEVVQDTVQVGVMHLAKGLEFRAVVAMGCDKDVLPLKSRIDAIEGNERQEAKMAERRLLYVACTRARERLLICGIEPVSEFLSVLKPWEVDRQ